jgi:hypothetical protein
MNSLTVAVFVAWLAATVAVILVWSHTPRIA